MSTNQRKPWSLFEVKDLVVVITGGGTGIGKLAAHALVEAGAKTVYVLGRRRSVLDECKQSCPRPDAIIPIPCDVTSKESLTSAADHVERVSGYCNLVLANAAIPEMRSSLLDRSTLQSIQKGLWERDNESYEQMFRINTLGAFHTAVAFLGLLDEGNRRAVVPQKSQIIVTSSSTGHSAASFGVFGYPATKAALGLMTKQLSGMLLPHKIRVNTIVAGYYVSEMTEGVLTTVTDTDPTQEGSIDGGCIPLQRVGSEDDIAGVILFLASKAGAYISGVDLASDGGMLAVPPSWALPGPPAPKSKL